MGATTAWREALANPPKWAVHLAALLMVAVMGWADFASGYEFNFTTFYLIPILVVGWFGGLVGGLAFAVLSAAAGVTTDVMAGQPYSSRLILVWEVVARAVMFSVVAYITARLRAQFNEQKRLAQTDALTGTLNSRRFQRVLAAEAERAYRYQRSLSLAYLDIDDFKRVNDTLGHAAGDELLAKVGSVLRGGLRNPDVVARLGGDEFAIILPETDGPEAERSMARLRNQLLEAIRNRGLSTTFSIGIVTCDGSSCTADEIVRRADELMYQVKASGKDGIRSGMVAPD